MQVSPAQNPGLENRSSLKKHRTFQEEEGFYFRQLRRLASAELRRFSPDSVTVHPPVVCCRSSVSLKKSAEGSQHVQSCLQCDSRTFEIEEIGFSRCTVAGLDAESR